MFKSKKKNKEVPTATLPIEELMTLPEDESSSNEISIGYNEFGENVGINLFDLSHLLISGYSGAGKTELIQLLMLSLMKQKRPSQIDVTIIANREYDYYGYEKFAFCPNGIISNTSDAVCFLATQVARMKKKFELFKELSWFINEPVKSILDYNVGRIQAEKIKERSESNLLKKYDFPRMKEEFIVFDEYAENYIENNAIAEYLEELLMLGRAVGMHVILSTQRPSGDILSPNLKANLSTRICLGTVDENGSRISIGDAGAENLVRGEALIFSNVMKLQQINVKNYSDKEKVAIISELKEQYPFDKNKPKQHWKTEGVELEVIEWVSDWNENLGIDIDPDKKRVQLRSNRFGW